MKRFVCKARLIRKEGYTGIFVTKKGLYLKLPYKDLEVGDICEVYFIKTTGKGHFEVFREKRIIGVPFYKGKNGKI